MDENSATAALVWISDMMLAGAAMYVTVQAIRGYMLERKAKRAHGDEQILLREDAKTLYAGASLSRPWVLILIFVGTAIKMLLGVYKLV